MGALDPSEFHGGEFLPGYSSGEVEIARIGLESFLADVISIRARTDGGQIRDRIVDEYENEDEFAPATMDTPLSLAELIHLIDTAIHPFTDSVGFTTSFRDDNLEPGIAPETLVEFVRVSSFFPSTARSALSGRSDGVAGRCPISTQSERRPCEVSVVPVQELRELG